MRRGPSRPSGGGGMPRVPSNGLARSRSTRQGGGGVDPLGYVGRRLWRLWPSESPPWVEGFIQFWDTGALSWRVVSWQLCGRQGPTQGRCIGGSGGRRGPMQGHAAQRTARSSHPSSFPACPRPPSLPCCRYRHLHHCVRPQHEGLDRGAQLRLHQGDRGALGCVGPWGHRLWGHHLLSRARPILSSPLQLCLNGQPWHSQGVDFVLGEYVDMTAVSGSKRQYETPWVPPEALAAPPPPGLLAAISPPPSKKRKSVCEFLGLGVLHVCGGGGGWAGGVGWGANRVLGGR